MSALRRLLNKRAMAYRTAFAGGSGAWVLADLSARFRAMAPTYVQGDPYETARREGERNVLLWIFSQMALNEDDIREMVDSHSRSGEYFD